MEGLNKVTAWGCEKLSLFTIKTIFSNNINRKMVWKENTKILVLQPEICIAT